MCHQLHPRVHILEKDLCLLFLWALQSWLNLWSVMGGIGQGGGRSLYVEAPKRPSRPGHPRWVGRRALRVTHGRGARNCARTYTTSGRGALAAGVTCRSSIRISISDTWTASLLGLSQCVLEYFQRKCSDCSRRELQVGGQWVARTGVSKLCTKAGCWEWQAGWRPHHQPPPTLRAS